jgi:FtsZ-binding cell division protein ZapB
MTPFPQLVAIDEAITALSKGNGDPVKIAQAMTEGIRFLGSVIDQLKEERAELIEDTEELIDRVEELERDQEIILQFMQSQGIDMSWVIRKEKSNDSDTSDNPN